MALHRDHASGEEAHDRALKREGCAPVESIPRIHQLGLFVATRCNAGFANAFEKA